jgi:integrase
MPAQKMKNGRWRYRKVVRLPDGSKARITGCPTKNTRAAAEQEERERLNALLLPQTTPSKPKGVPTLDEFSRVFLDGATVRNKPSEVQSKEMILRVHLKPAFGHLRLDRIGYAEIQDYVASKVSGKKPLEKKTVNNHLTVLRRVLVVAKKRGVLQNVPEIEWLRSPKPQFDFLTFEEAERLVSAAEGEWRCMILTAQRTGLRQGELLALRWEDVDLRTGLVTVRRSVTRGIVTEPKSGRSRDVPLGDDVLAALKAHRHLKGQLVFCTTEGRMFRNNECKHPLWRACKRAGLRRIGWHVLRHTFASHLVMRGAPLKAVQELMGHATVEMTMRYSHLSPNVPREAVLLLDSTRRGHIMDKTEKSTVTA